MVRLGLGPERKEGRPLAKAHNLGFPRIGAQRELKFALDRHFRGDLPALELELLGTRLRAEGWQRQARLDQIPVGDFSFYDHVLDTSFLLGLVPERARQPGDAPLETYFRCARGRVFGDPATSSVDAAEMTKWFDTNYHYLVPELSARATPRLQAERLLAQVAEARELGFPPKPVVLGPVSFLWLGKSKDGSERLGLLERLLPLYAELFRLLAEAGVEWIQVDEPALVLDLPSSYLQAFELAYRYLGHGGPKLLLASYFGGLGDNLALCSALPVHGLHIDAVRGRSELSRVDSLLPESKVLSLGVVDGRNVWRTDLPAVLDCIEPIHDRRGDNLWLAPSCSLLHVPVELSQENQLDPEVKSWLAFAHEKIDEVVVLTRALNGGRGVVRQELDESASALAARRVSPQVKGGVVRGRLAASGELHAKRSHGYAERRRAQDDVLGLPPFPTTTIGSFPQTGEIRAARRAFRDGSLDEPSYRHAMQAEVSRCIREQEELELDVLVHGEPERNDMVEYFGEQLEGFAFTQAGWVQSYGSRCVKPPILFGDVARPGPMTVGWFRYAQSLTEKPVKGMLTGPVTILTWSFVRDDQSREETCYQLALAIRDEVEDLERAGAKIIQIDEAALREGLPLRRGDWTTYLGWACRAFRICSSGVAPGTQIHTHMCYSEFNEIISAIASLDADVVTIETSRSGMELLSAFREFSYPNSIGPGVYDIHSPNIPSVDRIEDSIRRAARHVPADNLWINPDCGLKTRTWSEVLPALRNMVCAAKQLRASWAPAFASHEA